MEEHVRLRTAELEKANQLLKQEIEERKRAEDEIRMIRNQHELINSINHILEKVGKVDPLLLQEVSKDIIKENEINKPLHESLSNREYRVMLMLASGKSNKDIAKESYLSASTVSTYRARILDKLNLETTAELIRYAIKNNLID